MRSLANRLLRFWGLAPAVALAAQRGSALASDPLVAVLGKPYDTASLVAVLETLGVRPPGRPEAYNYLRL